MNLFLTSQAMQLASLSCIAGVGREGLRAIFNAQKKHKLDWSDFWVCTDEQAKKWSLSKRLINSIRKANKEHIFKSLFNYLKSRQIRVVCINDDEYPPLLAKIFKPPLIIYIKGPKLDWKNLIPFSVVGSRMATRYGERAVFKLVTELAQLNFCIVSGGMYGIDAFAHAAALEAGGKTIIVLGHGMDHIYPASMRGAHVDFARQGATFISEYPPWKRPTKGTFVARNSIVAGMSQSLLVIEAAVKSGTASTVDFALQEGRDVYAVPGPFDSIFSRGTKELISQGATLYTGVSDLQNQICINTI